MELQLEQQTINQGVENIVGSNPLMSLVINLINGY